MASLNGKSVDYKIKLSFDTKDSDQQFQAVANRMKDKLKSIATETNKTKYFTGLVQDISDVDAELSRLKAEHGDGFEPLYRGIGESIRQEFELVFGYARSEIAKFQQDIQNQNVKLEQLKALKKDYDKYSKSAKNVLNEENITGFGRAIDQKLVQDAYKSFDGLLAKKAEFERVGNTSSQEYLENYVQILKTASALVRADFESSEYDKDFGIDPDGLYEASERARSALEGLNIDAIFNTFSDAMDGVKASIKETTKLFVETMPNSIRTAFGRIGQEANADNMFNGAMQGAGKFVDKLEYIKMMAGQIKKLFNTINLPDVTREHAILMSGQDIRLKEEMGAFKEVSMQTSLEALLSQIGIGTTVSAHNHPGATSKFNAVDIKGAIDEFYSGTSKVSAIVGSDDITTLNLAGVKLEDALAVLQKIQAMDVKSISVDNINKLFAEINSNYINVARNWKPEQFQDLASYFYDIEASAENAVTPLERFKNILLSVKKDIDLSKYGDIFASFDSKNVGNLFNRIMEQEGLELRVDDINISSMDDVVEKIRLHTEAFAELRHASDVTYQELHDHVSAYYQSVKNGGLGENIEAFLNPYFSKSEQLGITDWLVELENGEASVNQITNRIAKYFTRIDPDEYITDSETQSVSKLDQYNTKLQEFNKIVNDINSHDYNWTAEDNVEIGKYTERLNVAKQELDALGAQAGITANELNQVQDAFDNSMRKLNARTVGYDSYYDGNSYSYDYYDEYQAEQDKNIQLKTENKELREQLLEQTKTINKNVVDTIELENLKKENGSLTELVAQYEQASDSVKTLVQQMTVAQERMNQLRNSDKNINTDGSNNWFYFTDEQKQQFLNLVKEYKAIIGEISEIQIVETDDDIQRLVDLMSEAKKLKKQMMSGHMSDSDALGYQKFYGVSPEQAKELKAILDGYSEYNFDENQLIEKLRSHFNDAFGELEKQAPELYKLILNSVDNAYDELTSRALQDICAQKQTAKEIKGTEQHSNPKDKAAEHQAEAQAIEDKNKAQERNNKLKAEGNALDGQQDQTKSDDQTGQTTTDETANKETTALELLRKKLVEVKTAVDEKTQAFEAEYVTVDAAVDAEIESLNRLKELLERIQEILQSVFTITGAKFGDIDVKQENDSTNNVSSAIQSITQLLGQILTVLQGFTGIESDSKNSMRVKEPKANNGVVASETTEKFASKLSDLATEDTLSKIPEAINELAEVIKIKNESDASKDNDTVQSLNSLINALNSNIKSLQDVMNGVVDHQKAQKSDTSKAMGRIQDPKQRQDILGWAKESVKEYSDDIEIESWQALANGLVKVEGAFKNVNGEWEGFTVKINESNKAVDLAIKKHSAFARFMQQSEKAEDNPVKYTPDEVYKNALKYMQEQDEKGNKATLQYKDSGRYTVSVKEQVGGLTKETFQTFDEFQSAMSRTTVTLSNDISTAIKDSNKLIVNNIDKVGNAGLLQQYNDEYADLIAMNQKYSAMDNLSAYDIATWNAQITLVQNLGNEVAKLIKQQDKLDTQSGVATSAKRLQEYQANADNIFNGLDFGLTSENKTPAQQKIVDAYDQIIEKINALKKSHSVLTDAQTQEIDALIASLKAEADAYQNTLGGVFKSDRDKKLSKFDLDKATLEADIAIPESFNQQIADARSAIENAVDDESLKIAINNWETLKNQIKETAVQQDLYIKKTKETSKATKTDDEKFAESVASKQTERNLQKIIGQVNLEKNDVGFNFNSRSLTAKQQEIVATYEKLIAEIDKYEAAVEHGQQAELDGINEVKNALFAQIDAYKQKYNIEHGGKTGNKKAPGATVVSTATTKYNALKNEAGDDRYAGSSVVTQSLERYTAAYEHLVNVQSQYKIGQKLTGDQEQEFNAAKAACSKYAAELDRLLKASKKFDGTSKIVPFAGDFDDTDVGRMSAISDTIQQLYDVKVSAENFTDSFTKCIFTVDNGDGTFTKMTATLNAAKNGINVFTGETQKSTTMLGKFFSELGSKFKSIGKYFIASMGWQEVWQALKQGVTYVREIDSALTELKKVTDETDASYERFLQNMSKTAGVIGSTVKDLTIMSAEWARLGYSMEEAGKLAESTAILLNVSEFKDATSASEALISTMQAFQYTADESQHVVDILNEIGNNYAVSSDGIATALQDSASALMEAGNNLEQSVALVAAANKVVQDPNSVGSALRTISLRLRGTSVKVLEEMGEETDGVVESVSKMQEKIKGLTGVDILTDSGAYKETYHILYEIGQVWNDLDNLDKSALLELMAGKNRANTLAAILNNMEDLEGAYNDALNAEGSALKENETYLESIQGHIDVLNNSVQTMWMNFLNSDAMKWFIHLADAIIKIVDNVGLLTSAMTVLGGIFVNKNFGDLLFGNANVGSKKSDISNAISKSVEDVTGSVQENMGEAVGEIFQPSNFDLDAAEDSIEGFGDTVGDVFDNAGDHVQNVQDNIDDTTDSVEDMGVQSQQSGARMSKSFDGASKSSKKLMTDIKNIAKSMLLMYAISSAIEVVTAGIRAISNAIKQNSKSAEVLNDKYQETRDQLENCESELKSLDSELKTTNDKIEELTSKGTLSFVEQEELKRLQAVSAELERQISMKKTLQDSLQTGVSAAAGKAGDAYLNTSFGSDKSKTDRQKEAEENGKVIGKGVGLAAGAAIALAIGGFFTGGMTWAGIPAALSSAGTAGLIAISAVGALGSVAGGAIGSAGAGVKYDQEQTVSEVIDNMNKSRDQLIKARDDAYEAYVSNPTDTDMQDKYEAAAQALSLYDENMANHISTLSQYYNTIASNWEKANPEDQERAKLYGDMLDKYNIEMGGVGAKQNAIDRIFGAEASPELQAVRTELEKMAEAGGNIDLKAAFGDDTDAYDAFVDRLYEMGIYVHECENAFKLMHKEAQEAAEVDFIDITKDINGVADAISGIKDAFDEFLGSGHVSAGTILNLEEYFNTEELKSLYNEYVGVMTSGATSIEEAQEATRKLAQAYLDDRISTGNITNVQKQAYITQLKDLGVKNAEEFIEHELQQAAIGEIQQEYKINGEVSTDKLDEISKKYAVELDLLNQLIPKLKEKNQLESGISDTKSAQSEYDTYVSQYKALLTDMERKQKEMREYANAVQNFNADDWRSEMQYGAGVYINSAGEVLNWEQYNDLVQQHKEYKNKVAELESLQKQYRDLLAEGFEKGFVNSDGSLKEGVEEGFANALQEAENAIGQLEGEIDAELDFEIDLELVDKPVIETVAGLTEALDKYKAALDVVNNISFDGQQISEDYYNTLKEQLQDVTAGTEDFFDAVDTSNGYIVKNVKLLQDLVAQSKQAQKATIAVAKAQAQLEYRKLVQQIAGAVESMVLEYKAYGLVTDATYDNISAMREQIDMLKQTMQQYSLLEISLSNAAKAYEEYEKAKQRDAQITYDETFEEAIKTIGDGLLKNETGTETFEYAVKAFVPEEVWSGIDDVNEKVKAIHDYIDGDEVFSKLFHVDAESGEIDINTDNVREFINMSKEAGLIDGDSTGFSLSADVKGIKDFADKLGITEAAALALLSATEKVDAKWGNILTDVMTTPLERKVNEQINAFDSATSAVEDYWKAVISGDKEYNEEEHAQLVKDAETAAEEYAKAEQAAEDNAKSWTACQTAIAAYRGEISLTQGEADALAKSLGLVDVNGNPTISVNEDGTLQFAEGQLDIIIAQLRGLEEPHIMRIQVQYDKTVESISSLQEYLKTNMTFPITINGVTIQGEAQAQKKLNELTATKKNIEFTYGITETSTEEDKSILESYKELAKNGVEFTVIAHVEDAKEGLESVSDAQDNIQESQYITITSRAYTAEQAIKSVADQLDRISSKTVTLTVNVDKQETDTGDNTGGSTLTQATRGDRGAVMALGNALATGNDGLSSAENNAVVGELGPEMVVDPLKGIYYTVGDNGTEMVNLPKGAIIYNHKQTEELLKNGHTTRGKYTGGLSFARGNAYSNNGIPDYHPNLTDKTPFANGSSVNNSWDDAADSLNGVGGAAEEFEETIDGIAIRMEELEEKLGLFSAELENAVQAAEKNNIIDEMIATNKKKYADSQTGADKYYEKANEYWSKIPEAYRELAKNGAIEIKDFTSKADEATVEAINKYREYAQKAADLTRQAEETITEIRDLAIQRIDNARESGEVRAAVEDSQTEKLQNRVDLIEAQGDIAGEAYYHAMMENSNKKIEYWGNAKETMQAEFDAAVRNGEIIRGSNEWYEMVNQLYEVDAEIAEATIELEEFQNAINDIHWDNFENLTNQIDYLKGQTQSLIDLMEKSGDLVAKPNKSKYEGGTVEYWTADDVKWTDEGLASLGLYAQQMEIAEFESRQYAEAIDELNDQYTEGRYSESEYLEKLEELTSAQYDSIEAYYEAQEAIVDLNEARVDMIKEGIEKEIDAYEELIDKQKELLDAEKDLHDFEESVMNQQKDIADIERRLASLANDNSMSAMAERKKLEAELAEAQYELQETYYDRSVEDKQNALDRELEDFQVEKDRELTKWEEYLDNVELVIADSLNTVQQNASGIYDTLSGKADEYNLTLSKAILTPWQDGQLAVSDYQDKFDTAMSSTMDQLTALKDKWRDVIEEMARASETDVGNINQENEDYIDEQPRKERPVYGNPLLQAPNIGTSSNNESQEVQPSLTKGSYVEVKPGTKWYENSAGGGAWGYARSGTIKYVNENGSHAYNIEGAGWIKKTDIVGYAKGTVSAPKSGVVNIDELGEELVLHAQHGRLAYMEKGSGVVPADLTSNLMEWGKLDPTSMIEDNRPSIAATVVQNKEVNIDLTYGDILHIEEFHGDDPDEIAKIVAKQFEKHTKSLNNAIRKFAR